MCLFETEFRFLNNKIEWTVVDSLLFMRRGTFEFQSTLEIFLYGLISGTYSKCAEYYCFIVFHGHIMYVTLYCKRISLHFCIIIIIITSIVSC